MLQVNLPLVTETGPHDFVTEASTLGLKPGEWPKRLNTDLGNRLPFILKSVSAPAGELLYVTYVQAMGCIELKVFND